MVLVGPSGAGKSAWAAEWFRPEQVVSSDRLRGLVGDGEHDQRAGKDAFDVLDLVLERRLRRGLLTVVDTLGLERGRRQGYVALAARHGMPCVAVAFDTAPAVCRARNKERDRPVPAKVLTDQLRSWERVRDQELPGDGFAAVHPPEPARVVAPVYLTAPASAARQKETPVPLRFGLQIPRFSWPGGPPDLARHLAGVAAAAEQAGFTSLWVMDHFLQIPQAGREWEDMPESYTTLAWLAGHTTSATLGTLVTGVTYRNPAHLAKIVATLDVLSGGRAVCGIGAGWYEREHAAYGWEFPPRRQRFDRLEDALQLLPLMWGKGTPPFSGRTIEVAEAMCYPRPLQEHVPILVGGGGERRTLRLVAQYADACNLFGDPAMVGHKLEVLDRHCADVGRDRSEIEVTQLSTVADGVTVGDHVGRFRELAEAGVQTAIVNFAELTAEGVERFAEVVAAFSDSGA